MTTSTTTVVDELRLVGDITDSSLNPPEDEPIHVVTSLGYIRPLEVYKTEKPYYSNVPLPSGRQGNIAAERRNNITINNMRTNLSAFSLDKQGFEMISADVEKWISQDWDSDRWIESYYYPFIEQMLRRKFGDVQVKIFDHTVRRRDPGTDIFVAGKHIKRQPSVCAHVDQTELSGVNRIKMHLGDDSQEALKTRCRIVNVWRPLFDRLEDYPLALCDCRTLNLDQDALASDLIFPHYIGEQYHIKYSPNHKWYFLNKQLSTEFLVFKCYDNLEDGTARLVPHAAFNNPLCPKGARFRESVEVRCIVVGE